MIYLDTAALVKILRREPESDMLAAWMAERHESLLVTSMLTEAELPRAVRRVEPEALAEVPALLQRLARYEIDESVRRRAAGYPDPVLRSLDAIHLATAALLVDRGLSDFVTYDRRLRAAAVAESVPVASPGSD